MPYILSKNSLHESNFFFSEVSIEMNISLYITCMNPARPLSWLKINFRPA